MNCKHLTTLEAGKVGAFGWLLYKSSKKCSWMQSCLMKWVSWQNQTCLNGNQKVMKILKVTFFCGGTGGGTNPTKCDSWPRPEMSKLFSWGFTMCARACERMSLWEQTLSLLDSANDRFLGVKTKCIGTGRSMFITKAVYSLNFLWGSVRVAKDWFKICHGYGGGRKHVKH